MRWRCCREATIWRSRPTPAALRAQAVAEASQYQFRLPLGWSNAALRFASDPDAADSAWLDLASAQAAPARLLFARVDTSALDAQYNMVDTAFIHALDGDLAHVVTGARAVAGRQLSQLLPLGVCALSSNQFGIRADAPPPANTEMLEFGYRRGVGYNLLALNPNGSSAKNYLINPIDPTSGPSHPVNFSLPVIKPFVCSGSMPAQSFSGAPTSVYVQQGFPGALSAELNSRFDDYSNGSSCDPQAAPPDKNVRRYDGAYAGWYMNAPSSQSARSAAISGPGSPLITVADLSAATFATESVSAGQFGPLWSFAKPVVYAVPMPTSGYTAFARTSWGSLYPANSGPVPAANAFYPSIGTPYSVLSGVHVLAPVAHPGAKERRVLQVPLLRCPLAAGSGVVAQVLGVGKFLMTAPANGSAIYAEFGGLVADEALTASVVLYK